MSSMKKEDNEHEKKSEGFWESDEFLCQRLQEQEVFTSKKGSLAMEQPCLKRRRKVSGTHHDAPLAPHPMFIDHVVEKVLDYSSDMMTSVKQFRLVCKKWNYIATKKYRTTYGRICFENDFNRKTSKFIQVMQNCSDMLFDKFKFSGGFVVYKPYQGHYGFDKIFNELFRICVPWMKTLEFSSHNPSDLKFPKNIRRYDLSNVSTISFHICVFYNNLQEEMVDYLAGLLDISTNLKTCDFRLVSADPSMQSDDQIKIMQKFGTVIATKISKTCKHLKLNMLINDNVITLLEGRELQLESLIIDFQKIGMSTKVIESFLKSQSKSLQNLEFIEAPFQAGMELPELRHLSFLKVEGKPKIPSFKFERALPKLKSVEILFYWIYQDEDWLKNVLVDQGQSQSVVDVEFLCEINEKDLFILHRITKCFPKLKRLSVVLNTPTALSILFCEMTFLEDLEISFCREFWGYRGPDRMGKVDAAFCGLPADLCIRLLRQCDFSSTEIPETMCREPSIRDLTQLQKLKIRGYRADQIPLTDVTVHFGLLKMKKLTHLILDIFPISKQCLMILGQHVKLQLLPGPPTLS